MKKAILAVSYGSGIASVLETSVVPLENAFAAALPDHTVRRAFTGKRIREALANAGTPVDSPSGALERLAAEGFDEVILQPSHVSAGSEYDLLCEEASAFEGRFAKLRIGTPLLYDRSDRETVCRYLHGAFRRDGRLTVLMGHGSAHRPDGLYSELNGICRELGFHDMFAAALEGSPSLDDILPALKSSGCERITLVPPLFTAGVHAVKDVAGGHPDSRKSRLEAEGFRVDAVLCGLGEYAAIRSLYVSHLLRAAAE